MGCVSVGGGTVGPDLTTFTRPCRSSCCQKDEKYNVVCSAVLGPYTGVLLFVGCAPTHSEMLSLT